MSRFTDHKSLLQDFMQQEFKMGAHKAFLFSRVAAQHELVLHTELSEADAGRCLLRRKSKGELELPSSTPTAASS